MGSRPWAGQRRRGGPGVLRPHLPVPAAGERGRACTRISPGNPDEAEDVAAEDALFVMCGQSERLDLAQLDTGVELRAVRAEKELAGSGTADGEYQRVEIADSAGVTEDVRIAGHLVDDLQLHHAVVGEPAQVRNDEVDIRG